MATATPIVSKALETVMTHVQANESITDLEALAEAHPDGLPGIMLDAFWAKVRGDSNAMNRAIRDAQMEIATGDQLELPGIEDGCFPKLVRVKDEDGQIRNIPSDSATFPQIKQEVSEMRRILNRREKVVIRYEQTVQAAEDHLPIDDAMTGADIKALSRALGPGASDE